MPNIIIGLNHGTGEISLDTAVESWAYAFEMEPFVAQFREQVQKVLTVWLEQTRGKEALPGYRVGRMRMRRCLDLLEVH
jgi:hypothetical protein